MKKIIIVLFTILTAFTYSKELKNVIIYEKDVSTGKVIDNGSDERIKQYKKEVVAKAKRYQELREKSSLSGKEAIELDELRDYFTKLYYETKANEEKAIKRNAALAEQDVIQRMTSEPVPEKLQKKEEEKSFLDFIF